MATVIITGIGQGIGAALADRFLSAGWLVVGSVLTSEINRRHDNLRSYPLDLRVEDSINHFVKQAFDQLAGVDILINNAGVLLDDDDISLDSAKLRATLEVNLIGLTALTERLLPLMASGGHIINISSTAGSLTLAGEGASHYPDHYPAYKISKAGLNMYTVTLARRLAASHITVSAVHPGWVKTAMGGEEAEFTPVQAAEQIFTFALTRPPSGRFWFNGASLPW